MHLPPLSIQTSFPSFHVVIRTCRKVFSTSALSPSNSTKEPPDDNDPQHPTCCRPLSDKELWERKQRLDLDHEKLGFYRNSSHRPFTRINHPTRPGDLTLALLLASQAHLGHCSSLWNTNTHAYIYGIRQGVHIISLDATLSHLRLAASVVCAVAANRGLILFVGTRPGQDQAVVAAAKRAGGYYLFERWLPGAITNGEYVIKEGKIKAEPKNSRARRFSVPDCPRSMKPDLVIVMNPLENRVLLRECAIFRIPTIGIIDTNADPSLVTYAIPANDDSIRCVEVVAGTLARAAEEGRLQREAKDRRLRPNR